MSIGGYFLLVGLLAIALGSKAAEPPAKRRKIAAPLQVQSAQKIAQQIWASGASVDGLPLAEPQKQLVLNALAAQLESEIKMLAVPGKELLAKVKKVSPEFPLLFARTWYLVKGKDIGKLLDVKNIGGFSIATLLDYNRIPQEVPRFGELHLFNQKINNLYGLRRINNLEDLKALYLSYNKIARLGKGSFAVLGNLEKLYVNSNRLKVLEKGVFKGLGTLRILGLNMNLLTRLEPGLFHDLPNLKVLYLCANDLNVLEKGIFDGLSNVQRVELGNNKLAELDPEIFAGLSNLRFLDLGYNKDLAYATKKRIKDVVPQECKVIF